MGKTVASMDILLHAKSKHSTSKRFCDIKILKNIQSDWSRAFSIATQELDFSQLWGFHRLLKATMVYYLKPKNRIDGPIFFLKIRIVALF